MEATATHLQRLQVNRVPTPSYTLLSTMEATATYRKAIIKNFNDVTPSSPRWSRLQQSIIENFNDGVRSYTLLATTEPTATRWEAQLSNVRQLRLHPPRPRWSRLQPAAASSMRRRDAGQRRVSQIEFCSKVA